MQDGAGIAREAGQEAHPSVPLDSGSLHDLLGPVNQLSTMADLMATKYRGVLDCEAEALLGFIQGAAARLQNLVGGLRTYSQVVASRAPHRRCEGNALVATALTLVRSAVDRSGALVAYGSLPAVDCDPTQISYVFAGLIDNAIKFRGQSRPEIHISAKVDGERMVYAFRDNGIGIDARHSESVFGVFKRIHNDTYPGAGVGLAIAKKIMEAHGGRIWVESTLGQGATFFLTLPTADNPGIHS